MTTPSRVRVVLLGLVAATLAATGFLGVPAVSSATAPAASARAAAANGQADWTMMVYAVADTSNVAQLMVENLGLLARLPEMPNVNVVVLVDLPARDDPGAPFGTLPGMGQFTTAKLLELKAGRYEEIRDLGEVSMGRPEVLADFIDEAAERFPADKYGLTLFDHGAGQGGGYIDTGPPGVQGLSIPEMRNAMITGMQRAGIDRFEVVNHAACLMANYETASALAPLTKTMVGSEEIMIQYPLSPQGFPPLGENKSGDEVGAALIDGYRQLLDDIAKQPGGQPYRGLAAMSVIDGDQQQILDRAMESFSQAAVAHMDEIATEVGRARAQALEFVVGFPGQGSSWDLVDLGDFLRNLQNLPPEVEVARDAAFAALKETITHQVTGQATQQATGLNVYLPTNRATMGDYLNDGTAPPGWAAFVESFLDAGTSGGGGGGGDGSGTFGFVSEEATVLQADASGIKIAGQLGSGDAAEVTASETQIYTSMGNRPDALAMVMPAYLNAGGEGSVQGVWDYSLTVVSNGSKSAPVSTIYQAQSGGFVGSFVAQYVSPSGARSDIGVRLLLSSQGEIQSVSVVDVSNGSGGGISLELGGTITPYLLVRSSGSFAYELSSQSVGITQDLAVGFTRLPRGTDFSMGVVVVNISGELSGSFVLEKVR